MFLWLFICLALSDPPYFISAQILNIVFLNYLILLPMQILYNPDVLTRGLFNVKFPCSPSQLPLPHVKCKGYESRELQYSAQSRSFPGTHPGTTGVFSSRIYIPLWFCSLKSVLPVLRRLSSINGWTNDLIVYWTKVFFALFLLCLDALTMFPRLPALPSLARIPWDSRQLINL